jgi:hypothetical protein
LFWQNFGFNVVSMGDNFALYHLFGGLLGSCIHQFSVSGYGKNGN